MTVRSVARGTGAAGPPLATITPPPSAHWSPNSERRAARRPASGAAALCGTAGGVTSSASAPPGGAPLGVEGTKAQPLAPPSPPPACLGMRGTYPSLGAQASYLKKYSRVRPLPLTVLFEMCCQSLE
eukprot:scaffold42058_cov42-Phaeocystis_antarctica.AAC.1